MPLTIGERLGSHEVTALIGKGGMGEVYRARDTKLKRDVAIKTLPDEFSHDADRLTRFQREAEVLASLNHPHIAAIYGLEEVAGTRCLILELVEGDTLADTIVKRGALPVPEALAIARQICDALEAAHDKGIVHRDLKPANIKVREDGTVKVLDFGLAKAFDSAPGAIDASLSPTISSPAMTRMGVILGTAAYMSPEQARGKTVDKRTDIWAFGAVLYEMLTGRVAFGGDEVTSVLARIIEREPDFGALPPITPEPIRRLLRRSLQKDRKRRLADASDVRLEIEDALAHQQATETTQASVNRRRERLAWGSALTIVTMIAAGLSVRAVRPVTVASELHLEITTPPTTEPTSLAISPDGTAIVFAATTDGQSRLWLRSLSSGSARALAGTEGAQYLFWSPDSRSVGFLGENRLKRIDIDSGSIQILANAPGMRGGSWNRDGVILFPRTTGSPIFRLPATGGEATPVLELKTPQQISHRSPQFLPDGRHFLYYVQGTPEARGVYVGQLDSRETHRLIDADAAAVYVVGQLLFVRQGTLFAQAFDPVRLVLTGDPSSVAQDVTVDNANSLAALSASAAGTIAYRTGGSGGERQFAWFDRSGKEIERIGSADDSAPTDPSLSPDGHRLALFRTRSGNRDIWLLDLARGVLDRFTTDIAGDVSPIWSSDGTRVVFATNRNRADGVFDLYQKLAAGGNETRLLTTGETTIPTDWSSDGRFLLYRSLTPKTGYDIGALPLVGEGKPFPVVQTEFEERDGQFSPDGKWIAYQSDQSGRVEVYVQPFPGPGAKTQISTTGGAQVRWRRDGKELFYIALDGKLMAVPVEFPRNGQTVEAGRPVALFETRIRGAVQGFNMQQYVVSPEGQRFLMNTIPERAGTSPITVRINWTAGSRK